MNNTHPLYDAFNSYWTLGADSYAGEAVVKSKSRDYLSATSGQLIDWNDRNSIGRNSYDAYKLRAVYPDIYRAAVEANIGSMHRKPPVIELPTALEPMRENSTLLGESLEMLLRRINARQLITGRIGLLGDVRADEGGARPVIVTYNEAAILNWDDTADSGNDVDVRLVVLNETGYVMDADLKWNEKERYLILALTEDMKLSMSGMYGSATVESIENIGSVEFVVPNISGNTLDKIPFVFVNGKDLSPSPDYPPQDGLANSCMTIYRGEADYRQNLFMQGQDTLVRIGAMIDDTDEVRTGAGARIDVPQGGDAKYIGVSSNGLSEQRQALENDYIRAVQKAGQLNDASSRAKESGEALKIRVAAQSATLPQIAMAGAAGLEKVLKCLAEWYGANPDEVVIEPNLDFTDEDLNAQMIVQLQQAKSLGAPISDESIHRLMREHGFTEEEFEAEVAKIEAEPI